MAISALVIALVCFLQVLFLRSSQHPAAGIGLLCLASNLATAAGIAWITGLGRFLPRRSLQMLILSAAAFTIAAAAAWNLTYRPYAGTLPMRHEAFRPSLDKPYSPAYGSFASVRAKTLLLLPASAALAGAGLLFVSRRSRALAWAVLLAAHLAGIAAFALSDSWARLAEDVQGFDAFSSDLARFSGALDLLNRYEQEMPTMSWVNRHYPPGTLLLFWLQTRLGWPGLVKVLSMLSAVAASVPLYLLARQLKLGEVAARVAVALYACSAAAIVYPTVHPSNLVLLPTMLWAWGLIRAIRTDRAWPAVVAAIALLGHWMLSFSFVIPATLMLALVAIALLHRQLSWKAVLRAAAVSAGIMLCGLALLRFGFGLNLLNCTLTGVRQHQLQMISNPFNPWQSYLLRSSGNILAYLMSAGPTAAIAGLALVYATRSPARRSLARPLVIAAWSSILVAGFSGLFWLETDRIWVFFTPFLCIAAGYGVSRHRRAESSRDSIAVAILAAIAVLLSVQAIFLPYL